MPKMLLSFPKSALRSAAVGSCRRFARDEQGATAIEYALIAAGITVAIATTVSLVGSKTNALFSSVAALFP
jgi:pilus assembly protein Flp/PilA